MKLHGYFRSSAAYRVRLALKIKDIDHEQASVHLTRGGGQQKSAAYLALNPQGLVPALEVDGAVLTQSLAIIEYLDETKNGPKLLPADALQRAKVRAFAQAIACDIHPINNLRVLKYLKSPLGHDQTAIDAWYRHWVETGLAACEAMLPKVTGPYCFGAEPTLADVCLVPQVFNARRFSCNEALFPRLVAIDAHCAQQSWAKTAAPQAQSDAE